MMTIVAQSCQEQDQKNDFKNDPKIEIRERKQQAAKDA